MTLIYVQYRCIIIWRGFYLQICGQWAPAVLSQYFEVAGAHQPQLTTKEPGCGCVTTSFNWLLWHFIIITMLDVQYHQMLPWKRAGISHIELLRLEFWSSFVKLPHLLMKAGSRRPVLHFLNSSWTGFYLRDWRSQFCRSCIRVKVM